jgi:hypothetical protein
MLALALAQLVSLLFSPSSQFVDLTIVFVSRQDVRRSGDHASNMPPTTSRTLDAMSFASPLSTHGMSSKPAGLLPGTDTVRPPSTFTSKSS